MSKKQKALPASIISRVKAFIIDMFLIAVPLLYITTYVILNGKNDFLHSQLAIFLIWLIYGLILSLFFYKTAQSPGYKSQRIYIIKLDGKKANFITYLFRYFMFVVLFIFAGSFFCFFRNDKRNLHDLLSQTIVVCKK